MASRIKAGALAVLLGSGAFAVWSDRSAAQPFTTQDLTSLAGGWMGLTKSDSNGKLQACMALRPPDKAGIMLGVFASPAGVLPAPFASPSSDVWGIALRSDSWQMDLGDQRRSVDVTFDAQAQRRVPAFVEDKHTLLIPAKDDEMATLFRKSYAMSMVFEGRHVDFSLAGTFRLVPVLTNCLRTSSIKGAPDALLAAALSRVAEKDCDEAVDLDRMIAGCNLSLKAKLSVKDRAIVYANRGSAYLAKGELAKALADYDAAVNLNPKDWETYANRGRAYVENGEIDRALGDFNVAIGLNPLHWKGYLGRGRVYFYKGDYNRALAEYDEAIRLDSSSSDAYADRAALHVRRGDFEIAITDAKQAISLDPKWPDPHAILAYTFAKMGDFGRAQSEIDEAFRLGSKNTSAFLYRGEIYLLKGEPQLALKDFEDVLALHPHSVFANAGRNAAQLALGAPIAQPLTAMRPESPSGSTSTFFGDENADFRVLPQNTLQSAVGKPTPLAIPGATTMTTIELMKAMQAGRPMVLIDALKDRHTTTIKGAVALPYAGAFGTFNDQVQTRLANALHSLLQGRTDVPLIFFCQGAKCWESYNAALRARAAGFQNVSWYRGGLTAWKEAGFPTQANQ
jgi:PQQ-dependent catabolism-associated CXXCW motif protein